MKEKNIVFGIRAVIEAVESGKSLEKVYIRAGLQGDLSHQLFNVLKENHIVWQTVPAERLARLTTGNHQGVVAVMSPIEYHDIREVVENSLAIGKVPLVLLLDGITDVRNFGAIARSAACAGADAIVLPEKGSVQVNADAIKTSAGGLFNIPVCRSKNLWFVLKFLKEKGFTILGASEKSDYPYYKTDLRGPVAIVMGSEDKGISSQVHKMIDSYVSIPLKGEIESLNVSVAAGILIFEVLRQRAQ